MSSSLLSFLSPAKIEEKLPENVMPKSVSSGSIVQYRNRVRYIPTSGATYTVPTGSKIVQFRITGNDYLDLSTACLHFVFDNNSTAPTNALVQEGIFSIIQRVRVALNSVIVQDVDNAHVVAHTKVLNTMPRQVYESAQGNYLGLYKRARYGLNTVYPPTLNNIIAQVSGYYNSGITAEPSGSSFYIPLSLIASSMGMQTFLPLRNVGSLELTFFLEDPGTCLYGVGGVTGGAYQLNDVSIEVDAVQLAAPIVQMMDRLASDVSETGGIVIPVACDVTQNINYAAGSGNAQRSVSISRGTTALTSLCYVKRLQSQLGTSTNQSLSSFQPFTQTRQQIRVGSQLYPQTATDSLARAYTETSHAYGQFNNINGSGGLVTRLTYETNDNDQGAFSYCYNFRRVLTEELGLDGLNTISAGSIIQVDLTDNPTGAAVMTAVLESLRYIELKGSAVNVTGL
jgi:hypothetical protein